MSGKVDQIEFLLKKWAYRTKAFFIVFLILSILSSSFMFFTIHRTIIIFSNLNSPLSSAEIIFLVVIVLMLLFSAVSILGCILSSIFGIVGGFTLRVSPLKISFATLIVSTLVRCCWLVTEGCIFIIAAVEGRKSSDFFINNYYYDLEGKFAAGLLVGIAFLISAFILTPLIFGALMLCLFKTWRYIQVFNKIVVELGQSLFIGGYEGGPEVSIQVSELQNRSSNSSNYMQFDSTN